MKGGLNQSSSWALAIILSMIFFGVGIAMMLKVADHEKAKDNLVISGKGDLEKEGEILRPGQPSMLDKEKESLSPSDADQGSAPPVDESKKKTYGHIRMEMNSGLINGLS